MIDSGKDDDESEPEVTLIGKDELLELTQKSVPSNIKIVATTDTRKEIKIPSMVSSSPSVSITLPANLISRSSIHTSIAGLSSHKKLVKNPTPTTAKVSIGNTTISVPVVLKNMPMQSKGTADTSHGAKKIMTSQSLTISNLKKNSPLFNVSGQKINTSTIVTLSLNKGTTRPIQTVQRFQQKPGQPTQSIIVPISSYVTSSPSSSAITNIISSVGIVSSSQSGVTSKMSENKIPPVLTFSKMSTLTMTQDTSLPSKILEDDEVLLETEIEIEKKIPSIDDKKVEMRPVFEEAKSNDEKVKSQIPVHVIIKSRESSQSPVLHPAQRKISANMSQLSPLSQPIEINTNTHNATQQIRSIMSSINSNDDAKNKTEAEQTSTVTTVQQNNPNTLIRTVSTPSTGNELKMIVSQQNTLVPLTSNVQTSQGGNILFVKQIRATSSQNATTSNSIVMMSQPGQNQSQNSVIISNKPSNLLSILSNQKNVKSGELKIDANETDTAKNTVTILKTNPAITNLLNTNSFKRSKSTDDATVSKDLQEMAAKRLSLESSNTIKSEPLEPPVVKEIQKQEHVILPTSVNIGSLKPLHTPAKSEDSQNVLLKQLLQNSGSSVSSPLTRTVPGIISNQRAPSLGVFSSLEAQLARPVVPPVAAKPIVVSTQSLVTQVPITTAFLTETNVKSTSAKLVSRETSFVSQTPIHSQTTTSSVNIQSLLENKPVVVLNRNDVPANMLTSSMVS